jgi:hypothetical protein
MAGLVNVALSPTAPAFRTLDEAYTVVNDLYVQLYSLVEQLNRYSGVVRSPNGHYWRIEVSNSGTLSTTDLGLIL